MNQPSSPLFWTLFPLRSLQNNWVEFPVLYSRFSLVIYLYIVSIVCMYVYMYVCVYIYIYICQSQSPNSSHPFSLHLGIYMVVLYVCVSISALQIRSSIPFFWLPHISVNIWYLFSSSWLIHCEWHFILTVALWGGDSFSTALLGCNWQIINRTKQNA